MGEVGDLVWIKLFRRIIDNPNWKKISKNPNFKNGLKFLNDYTVAEANKIMTSPEYTRAIFVRDPKERFVAQHEEYANNQGRRFLVAFCCESEGNCIDKHKKAKGFANLINSCNEAVWRPQAHRMEPKYFKTLDFIGHYENIREDSRRLLERIGAWDEYGKSGWGVDGSEEIFDSSVTRKETMVKKLKRFYKDPKLERKVERLYSADYSNALFNFTVMKLSE